jgi:hypothetical protein
MSIDVALFGAVTRDPERGIIPTLDGGWCVQATAAGYDVIGAADAVLASFDTNAAAWSWLDRNDPAESEVENRLRRISLAMGRG